VFARIISPEGILQGELTTLSDQPATFRGELTGLYGKTRRFHPSAAEIISGVKTLEKDLKEEYAPYG